MNILKELIEYFIYEKDIINISTEKIITQYNIKMDMISENEKKFYQNFDIEKNIFKYEILKIFLKKFEILFFKNR